MRKICIVTGTRAEWGLLSGLASRLRTEPSVQLQILATNMHLSPKYGRTIEEIRRDGFDVDWEVQMIDDNVLSTPAEAVRAMGREMTGFAAALTSLKPDMLVILGDRYEMLVAASAALLFNIPVAHLHGGEITEGAVDDSIRHAITKLSALHFTSTAEYRRRVIQMGESPNRVFCVGSLGCENALKVPRQTKEEIERSLGFALTDKCFLVTYHPVTREGMSDAVEQVEQLLFALDAFPDYRVLLTAPNSDVGSDAIAEAFRSYCGGRSDRACFVQSLGRVRYLSALPLMSAVIGNSSSGLIEVPSFGVPTVNVGHRQDGRVLADSVICCGNGLEEIKQAIRAALEPSFVARCKECKNPYAMPDTADVIAKCLIQADICALRKKSFYDLER